MEDKDKIERYVKKLKSGLQPKLRPGVGMNVKVYPAHQEGGVVEVVLSPSTDNGITIVSSSDTVNDILKFVPQKLIAGNLDSVTFGGTNISMEGNRILFIKGEDGDWEEKNAEMDLSKALHPMDRS